MKRILATAGLLLSLNAFPAFANEITVGEILVKNALESCREGDISKENLVWLCAGRNYGTIETLAVVRCAELFQIEHKKCRILFESYSRTDSTFNESLDDILDRYLDFVRYIRGQPME